MLKVDWIWYEAKSRTGGLYGKDMRVSVQYEYAYDGTTYRGDHVGFEPFAARNETLYRTLETAKRNNRMVTAWVNPKNPADAVLETNVSWIAIATYTAIGALLAGIGLGLLVLAGRATWPSKSQ